jgi:DNA helicase-2/ATP-dependent DNA helicase PcrA
LAEVHRWVSDQEAKAAAPAARERVEVAWPMGTPEATRAARLAAVELVRSAAQGPLPMALNEAEQGRLDGWRDEAAVVLAELRRERARQRDVALPRRLTTSQLVMLAEDPGQLARSLARPMPARPLPQARRGTRFHAWVESLFGERPLLEPDELPGSADAEVSDAELADLRTRFLASEYAARQPVAVEVPFELTVGGRLLRGRMDAVYPTAAGYEVIDYKTGEPARDFAAASVQLSVYRLAWAEIQGVDPRRVSAGFFYVRTATVRRPERLLDREELLALVRADPHLSYVDLALAHPGESVRIVNLTDAVEPRVKVGRPGVVYPGVCGRPITTVGQGSTHRLAGVGVVESAPIAFYSGNDGWVPGPLVVPGATAATRSPPGRRPRERAPPDRS